MNIFPFTLPADAGRRLFINYLNSPLRHPSTRERGWYWSQVDAIVQSPTRVLFRVFDDEERLSDALWMDLVSPQALAGAIAQRKLELAEQVLIQREAEAARLARAKAIDAVHLELFGDLPGDAP